MVKKAIMQFSLKLNALIIQCQFEGIEKKIKLNKLYSKNFGKVRIFMQT